MLVEYLSPAITKMSLDTNGNHVVQSFLKHMPGEPCHFIYETMVRDILILAKHRHGCCVFQRCLDAGTTIQRKLLIESTIANMTNIIKDPFGNYVVQYVMERCTANQFTRMVQEMKGRLNDLSMQKFSSNVVEKALQLTPVDARAELIDELLSADTIIFLMRDQFANYVLQRIALLAEDRVHLERLVNAILPHLSSVRKSHPNPTRRLVQLICKHEPSFTETLSSSARRGSNSPASHEASGQC